MYALQSPVKRVEFLLVIFPLFISGFAGGDPKPEQHVRVLPVHEGGKVGGMGHHLRREGHRRFPGGKGGSSRKLQSGRKKRPPAVNPEKFKLWEEGPNFDTDMRQDVVALEGKTAYLTCRVFDRGNKTVSPMGLFSNSELFDLNMAFIFYKQRT